MNPKINIGCGDENFKGYYRLDYDNQFKPDKIWNLNKFPYPFKDNTWGEIYTSHVLEHIDDIYAVLYEMFRITKVGGIIHIKMPHHSNGWSKGDFTHKRWANWKSFDSLNDNQVKYKFHYKIVFKRLNYFSEDYPKINLMFQWFINAIPKGLYERFLWQFPFLSVHELEVKLEKTR